MMKFMVQRAEQARREAQDMLTRDRAKEAEIVKEREKMFSERTQTTERLRALRLAREAEDRLPVAKNITTKPKARD